MNSYNVLLLADCTPLPFDLLANTKQQLIRRSRTLALVTTEAADLHRVVALKPVCVHRLGIRFTVICKQCAIG